MLNGVVKEDYLFTNDDYDTFKEEYHSSIRPDIMDRRHRVQEKLDLIHKEVLPEFVKKGYNISIHPAADKWPRLKYSWDRPVPYNKGKVDWMGIRYGRKTDIDDLNFGITNKDQKIGFQKYTCFQIDVAQYGLEVGIFHAVPHDSIDRMNMHEKLRDDEFRSGLVNILKQIEGYGFVWSISPKGTGTPEDVEHIFNFDIDEIETFPDFYEKYDVDGTYSSLLYRFPKWDRRVLKENITKSCLDIFDLLYPVYDYIKWKRKEGVQ